MTVSEEIESLKSQLVQAKTGQVEAEIILEILKKYISICSLDAKPYVDRLQQVAEKMASKVYMAWALCYQAAVCRIMRHNDDNLTFSQRALELFTVLNEDRGIICVYNNMGATYFSQAKYGEALEKYLLAAQIAEKINYQLGITTAFHNVAMIYRHQGDYSKCMNYNLKALQIRQEIRDMQGIASSYNSIGIVQKITGNYPAALNSHLASLKIAEKIAYKIGIANACNNIGLLHENMKNYAEALRSFRRALQLKEEIGDRHGVAQVYNNMGIVHNRKGNQASALKYYLKTLNIYTEIGDKRGVGGTLISVGFAYSEQGNLDKALKNLFSGLEICKEIGDVLSVAHIHNNIGKLYQIQGKYQEAINHNLHALEIAHKIDSKKTIAQCSLSLNDNYKSLGLFENALKYHEKYHQIESEILGEQAQKQLTALNFQHNMEQKEKELEIQKLKNIEFETILDKMKLTAIRAQLEPHFIGNALASIQSYIREQPEIAESYLSKFSRLMFDVLVKFKEDFISLEDELSILRDYMDLEALRRNHGFEYKIKVASTIEVETMQVPPLILQPIVENAIKHGMAKGNKKGLIKLDIKLNKRMLICNVENTVTVVIENGNQKEKRKSFGLQIIRDRLDILSKEKKEKGFLELIPLKNKMKVQLGIPV